MHSRSMSRGRSSLRETQRGPSPALLGGRDATLHEETHPHHTSRHPDLSEVLATQHLKEEADAKLSNRKKFPVGRRDPPDRNTGAHFTFGQLGIALLAAKKVRQRMMDEEETQQGKEESLKKAPVNPSWK